MSLRAYLMERVSLIEMVPHGRMHSLLACEIPFFCLYRGFEGINQDNPSRALELQNPDLSCE